MPPSQRPPLGRDSRNSRPASTSDKPPSEFSPLCFSTQDDNAGLTSAALSQPRGVLVNATKAQKKVAGQTRFAERSRREAIETATSPELAGRRAAVWVGLWDRGSRSARLRILEAFALLHSASNISRIESDLGDSCMLFFTRVTAWLRLTCRLGVELRPLLCAVALLVRGVRYLTCFMEIGGAEMLIDTLGTCSLSVDDRRETTLLLLYMANAGRVYREMLCDGDGVELLLYTMTHEDNEENLNLLAALLAILGEGNIQDVRTHVQVGLARLILDATATSEAVLQAARTLRTFQATREQQHAETLLRSGKDEDDGAVPVVGIDPNNAVRTSRQLLSALFSLVYHDDLRLRVEGTELLTMVSKNIQFTSSILTRCLDVVDEDCLIIEAEDNMTRAMSIRRHQLSFGSTAVNVILVGPQCEARHQLQLDIIARRSAHFTLLKYLRLLEIGYTASILDGCRVLQLLCRGAQRQKYSFTGDDVPLGVTLEKTAKYIYDSVGKTLYNVLLYEDLTDDECTSIHRAVKSVVNDSKHVNKDENED